MENRKLLEQELRSLAKKKRSVKTVNKTSGEVCKPNNDDISLEKQERTDKSRTSVEKLNKSSNWKQIEKPNYVDTPVTFKRKSFAEPSRYGNKYEKRHNVESPVVSKKNSSREIHSYPKRSEKRVHIESSIASEKSTFREMYHYWKKSKKRRNAESSATTGTTSSETSDWKRSVKRNILNPYDVSKQINGRYGSVEKYEKIVMMKKDYNLEPPVFTTAKHSGDLPNNWKKSEYRHNYEMRAEYEGTDHELSDYSEENEKILMGMERREVASPEPPSEDSSVEIIDICKKDSTPSPNEIYNNSCKTRSSSINSDNLNCSAWHANYVSSGCSYFNSSESCSKFCENCSCLREPNFNSSGSVHCCREISSCHHSRFKCIAKNNFSTANICCNNSSCCTVTNRFIFSEQPLCHQHINVMCASNYSRSLNFPQKYKLPVKNEYFMNRERPKAFFSPYSYAPKDPVYTWKPPQSTSISSRKGQVAVTKEQLDNELDSYMAEGKFESPTTRADDIQPFVDEYMTEVEKCTNEQYTVDHN